VVLVQGGPIGREAAIATLVGASMMASAASANYSADFNQAVRVVGGKRQVELPPLPPQPGVVKPIDESVQVVFMVEAEPGLVECVNRYCREGECRPLSIGRVKLLRAWVVKSGGSWWVCSSPDGAAVCGGIDEKFDEWSRM
jgi:hypothetical protein